jgi:hypothetical protein
VQTRFVGLCAACRQVPPITPYLPDKSGKK